MTLLTQQAKGTNKPKEKYNKIKKDLTFITLSPSKECKKSSVNNQ